MFDCLLSIASLDYPPALTEVIVVDDGGSLPAQFVVSKFKACLNVDYVSQDNNGAAAARNAGAARAKAEYLAFLDDDCTVPPQWLRVLEGFFRASPDAVLGGGVDGGFKDSACSRAEQLILGWVLHYHNRVPGKALLLPAANISLRKDLFHRYGGFDPRFRVAEDREFCRRLYHRGAELSFNPDAAVIHWQRLGFDGFLRQFFRYGRGAYHFRRELLKHAPLPREFDLSVDDAVRFFGKSFKGKNIWEILCFLALLGAWQGANLLGYAWEMARSSGVVGGPLKKTFPD